MTTTSNKRLSKATCILSAVHSQMNDRGGRPFYLSLGLDPINFKGFLLLVLSSLSPTTPILSWKPRIISKTTQVVSSYSRLDELTGTLR